MEEKQGLPQPHSVPSSSILCHIIPAPLLIVQCHSLNSHQIFVTTPWLWELGASPDWRPRESSAPPLDPTQLALLLWSLCRSLPTEGHSLSIALPAFCSQVNGPWQFLTKHVWFLSIHHKSQKFTVWHDRPLAGGRNLNYVLYFSKGQTKEEKLSSGISNTDNLI